MECSVVELRQYTHHPGQRDVLIALFEREFVESQEELGMTVIGQFRVLGDPDRFFWLRGFADMQARKFALNAFYGGPIWQRHRDAANATLIDSDNVLLLRPARSDSGFDLALRLRPELGGAEVASDLHVANICYFNDAMESDFVSYFERTLAPLIERTGARVCAYFVTERSPNDYPRLPVREDENVFVWFAKFSDGRCEEHLRELQLSQRWRSEIESLRGRLRRPIEVRRLTPTSRSLLR